MSKKKHPLIELFDFFEKIDDRIIDCNNSFNAAILPYLSHLDNESIIKLMSDTVYFFMYNNIIKIVNDFRDIIDNRPFDGLTLKNNLINEYINYYNKIIEFISGKEKIIIIIKGKDELANIDIIQKEWLNYINNPNQAFITRRLKSLKNVNALEIKYYALSNILTYIDSTVKEYIIHISKKELNATILTHSDNSISLRKKEYKHTFGYLYPKDTKKLERLYDKLCYAIIIKDDDNTLFDSEVVTKNDFVNLFSSKDYRNCDTVINFTCKVYIFSYFLAFLKTSKLFKKQYVTIEKLCESHKFTYTLNKKVKNIEASSINNAILDLKSKPNNIQNPIIDFFESAII